MNLMCYWQRFLSFTLRKKVIFALLPLANHKEEELRNKYEKGKEALPSKTPSNSSFHRVYHFSSRQKIWKEAGEERTGRGKMHSTHIERAKEQGSLPLCLSIGVLVAYEYFSLVESRESCPIPVLPLRFAVVFVVMSFFTSGKGRQEIREFGRGKTLSIVPAYL